MASKSERAAAQAKKDKAHDRYVTRTYGLVAGQYAAILASQGGVCAICGKRPRKRYLAVDHDHRTGAVRGLLCYFCNVSIGTFEFDPATARRASDYLAKIGNTVVAKQPNVVAPVGRADTKSDPSLPF